MKYFLQFSFIVLLLVLHFNSTIIAKEDDTKNLMNRKPVLESKDDIKKLITEPNEKKNTANEPTGNTSDQKLRETNKKNLEKKRTELKNTLKQNNEKLSGKLQQFKDQKKALTTEKISNNLNKINEQRTSKMTENITKMYDVVAKLENRIQNISSDTSQIKILLENARTAISNANTSITEQAGKSYVVTVNSEDMVKNDLKATRNKLLTDLKAVNQTLVTAKQALTKTINAVTGSTKETTRSTQEKAPQPTKALQNYE